MTTIICVMVLAASACILKIIEALDAPERNGRKKA